MITMLVNTVSGGGKAQRALPLIEGVLKQEKKEYVIRETYLPGDAFRLAREAVECAHEAIIVAGGDGTMSEVINAVGGSEVAIIFAPCGTGNDFIRCMNIPKDPVQAIKKQLDAPMRRLDYAKVNDRAFLNVCGAGFDVDVLRHLEAYRSKMSGMKAYLFALKDALKDYRPLDVMISVDDQPFEGKQLCILSIGNGKYFGGGMKVAPDAVPYDGILNIVMIRAIKKWVIPFLLPLFITGMHVKLPITTVKTCKSVRVISKGMTMQLDGELADMHNADIRIVPGGVGARC